MSIYNFLSKFYKNNNELPLDRVHGRIRVRFVIIGDQIKLKKVQYKMKIDDGRFKISSLRNLNEKIGESNALFTEVKLVINLKTSYTDRRTNLIENALKKNKNYNFRSQTTSSTPIPPSS